MASAAAFVAASHAEASAKLIELTFTLTNAYFYSMSGQLGGGGSTCCSAASSAKLTRASSTIFQVNAPPFVQSLYQAGILPPGTYTLSVDLSVSANPIGFPPNQTNNSANFNFLLSTSAIPTPTPPSVTISGVTTLCAAATPIPLSGVTMTLSGNTSGSTTTNAGGFYQLSGMQTGSYTVTPTKARRTPGGAGINTVDVVATQNHVLNRVLAHWLPTYGWRLRRFGRHYYG